MHTPNRESGFQLSTAGISLTNMNTKGAFPGSRCVAIGYFDANLCGKYDFRKATGQIKQLSLL